MIVWMISVAAATQVIIIDRPQQKVDTLQEALDASMPRETIELGPGVHTTDGAQITHAVTIIGAGQASTTVRPSVGAGGAGTIQILFARDVKLADLTVENSDRVRALFAQQSTVSLDNVQLLDAGLEDGTSSVELASVLSSDLTVTASTLRGGYGQDGGSMTVTGSLLTVVDSQISDAFALGEGGALRLVDTVADFRGTLFRANAGTSGGSVFASGSPVHTVRFDGCTFEGSQASFGGAVFAQTLDVEVVGSSFDGNLAAWGGAIATNDASRARIEANTFDDNAASGHGGAVDARQSDLLEVVGNTFRNNHASSVGGTLHVAGEGSFDIAGNVICDGSSASAGGIGVSGQVGTPEGEIRHNVFVGAVGTNQGTTMAFWDAAVTVRQNVIVDIPAAPTTTVWADGSSTVSVVNNAVVGGLDLAPDNVQIAYNVVAPGNVMSVDWFEEEKLHCDGAFWPVPGGPLVDAGDPTVLDGDGTPSDVGRYGGPGATSLFDLDGDGMIEGDCFPYDVDRTDAEPEVVGDGIDQDCDGMDLCHADEDNDGVGGEPLVAGDCAAEGLAASGGDCDDADATRAADCSPVVEPPIANLPGGWFCASGASGPWGAGVSLVLVGLLARRRAHGTGQEPNGRSAVQPVRWVDFVRP